MIIGIDIGNTHIVTGIYDNRGELISTFRLATNDKMTEDEYFSYFNNITKFNNISIEKVDAILISSVLFGAYHLNIVQATYATLMGIVAAIIYEKKKNLAFPIFVHFANNFVAMVQSFSPQKIDGIINIFSVIMMIPLGYIIYRLLKDKRAEMENIQQF